MPMNAKGERSMIRSATGRSAVTLLLAGALTACVPGEASGFAPSLGRRPRRDGSPRSLPSRPGATPVADGGADVRSVQRPSTSEPPAASLSVEGGDPVVGQLGSFTWNGGGSDGP